MDNLWPRGVQELSRTGKEELATLLGHVGAAISWPRQLLTSIVGLSPKDSGGQRARALLAWVTGLWSMIA